MKQVVRIFTLLWNNYMRHQIVYKQKNCSRYVSSHRSCVEWPLTHGHSNDNNNRTVYCILKYCLCAFVCICTWPHLGVCIVWLATWFGQPRRKTIPVSSPPHCDRHLTGRDPSGVQEPPGWERSTMTFSPRTLESTRRGGRQGAGRSDNKSLVRQRSVRSTLPRRRRRLSGFGIPYLALRLVVGIKFLWWFDEL